MALVLFGLNFINNAPFLVNEVIVVLVEDEEEVVDGAVGVQEVREGTPPLHRPEGHDFIITQLAVKVGVLQRVDNYVVLQGCTKVK